MSNYVEHINRQYAIYFAETEPTCTFSISQLLHNKKQKYREKIPQNKDGEEREKYCEFRINVILMWNKLLNNDRGWDIIYFFGP